VQNDAFKELFGRDAGIAVARRPEGEVFDPSFLEVLRDTHIAIEDEVPHVVEVTSLWNVRETLGSNDGLEVRDLLEEWPDTPEALAALEARARSNPLYRNFMLSEDGRSTMIVVETEGYSALGEVDALGGFDDVSDATAVASRRPITGDEDAEILAAVEAILTRLPGGIEVHVAGMASFTTILQRTIVPDMGRATGLSVLVAAVFLAALFRSRLGVVPCLVAVEAVIARVLGPDLDYEITGEFELVGNTIDAALRTMARSYSTALVVITLFMIMLIGRVRLGLMTMIPNLAPVVFTLGLMGWLGLPLDMLSLMSASIVIGLAVDGTIHFMHNFRREFKAGNAVPEAVDHTLRSTGQALLFTSFVLTCSFLVCTRGHLLMLYSFGVTISAAIVVAFLADVTLAPALVAIFAQRLTRRRGQP